MFWMFLSEYCGRRPQESLRFLSIGSGNCELEMDLVSRLKATGCETFVMDCLDLSSEMLERGRSKAIAANLDAHFNFLQADFNDWQPEAEYDVIISNQALHHVVAL